MTRNPFRALLLRPLPILAAVALLGCTLGFACAEIWDAQFLHIFPFLFLLFSLILAHVAVLYAARFRVRALPISCLICFVLWSLCAAFRTVPNSNDIAQRVRTAPDMALPQRALNVRLRGTIADEPRFGEFGIEFPFEVNRVLEIAPKRSAPKRSTTESSSQKLPAQNVSAPGESAQISAAKTHLRKSTTDFLHQSRASASGLNNGATNPLAAVRVAAARDSSKQPIPANWRATRGRVWVRLPLPPPNASKDLLLASVQKLASLESGDAISLRAELSDLPRAGNFGERETRARFLTARCWALAKVKKSANWKLERRTSTTSLSHRLTTWRRAIASRYDDSFAALKRPFPFASSQLLVAMVFGEGGLSEPLPRATRDRFRAAGMSHLLVASGTQVAFLALILLGAAKLFGLRKTGLLLLVLPVLLLYALLTGGASSIWRATLGGACVAWALLLGRDVDGLSLWSFAVVVLLGIDPLQLHDLGFQLTFGATWGLLVLAPPLRKLLRRAWGDSRVLDAAALTVSAQIATTPLLMYHFGRLSFSALGANFLAIPMAGILVGSGILGLIFPLGSFNYHVVRTVDNLATFAANAPGAQSGAPPLRLGWTIFAYVLILAALSSTRFPTSTNRDAWIQTIPERAWKKLKRFRPQGFAAIVALLLSVFLMWRTFSPRPKLRVTLLDVGQGESLLIQSPGGRNVLIDGGTSGDENRGEVGRAVIVPFLQAQNISKIDVMILTHADADHCNGLPQIVREVPVEMALDGAALYAQRQSSTRKPDFVAEYEAIKTAWRDKNISVKSAQSGQRIDLGDGAILTFLAPSQTMLEGDNNNGAVLRLDYGKTSFLFTADIEKEAEERLLRKGANLKATVLKVGHHGSKTSSTSEFLRAVNPSVAIISCGRYNKFGHPNAQTMANLAAQKIPTFRTDISGQIEVACDGKTCDVQTFR